MKKMIIGFAALISLSVALTGCNAATTKDSAAKEKSSESLKVDSEVGKKKETDDFEITIESAQVVDNPLNTDLGNVTLEVKVKAKNISKEDQGLGTADFKIIDANKEEHLFTSHEDNFGDLVEPGKTIEGAGYYSVPKDMDACVIVYNPFQTSTQLKWEAVIDSTDQ
jgi:hypothetical protein